MTIQGDFTNKPNSGCLTPEINRQMANNTANFIKKADEAVDKFIKSDEGIEKKNSLKKKIGAGILAFAGIGAVATWAIKSGKLNKIKNLFTKKAGNVNKAAKKTGDEIAQNIVDKSYKYEQAYDAILQNTEKSAKTKEIAYKMKMKHYANRGLCGHASTCNPKLEKQVKTIVKYADPDFIATAKAKPEAIQQKILESFREKFGYKPQLSSLDSASDFAKTMLSNSDIRKVLLELN